MVKTVEAVFDGSVLRPAEPLVLPPNTRVKLTVETLEPAAKPNGSFLQTAQALNLDGPADWAQNVDHYLYGSRSAHE